FDALGQDVADDAATRIRAHKPLPQVLLGAGHAAAAGRLVGAVDEVGSDRPGPFGPHDGLAAGHGGHADVTAWRVDGVDAARGEAGKLHQGEVQQLEGVGDGVPDGRDAVVVNLVNNKFDG